MQARSSTRLILFLLAVKRFLNSHKLGLEQLFAELKLSYVKSITLNDFSKIVERINRDGENFSPYQIFLLLAENGSSITRQDFKKKMMTVPSFTVHKLQSQQSIESNPQQTVQQKYEDSRKKLAKKGFDALVTYIHTKGNNPQEIFDDCDEDHSGNIDRNQMNKFFYASEIEELKDKETRRLLIAQIFENRKDDRISKQEFFQLFRFTPKFLIRDKLQPKRLMLQISKTVVLKKSKQLPSMNRIGRLSQKYNLSAIYVQPQKILRKSLQKKTITEQEQRVQIRKKFLKRGFKALAAYIHTKGANPQEIFDDCDEDHSGDIDRNQFNKFLYASEIEELKDKETRRYLVAEIFDNAKDNVISKQDFFKLFEFDQFTRRFSKIQGGGKKQFKKIFSKQ